MPRAIAIFDFDGTLIPNPSSEWRFIRFLVHRRRLGLQALLRSAAFAVRWWPGYGRHVLKKNKAYLAGMPVAEIESLAREFVPEVVLPLLRAAVMERLRLHHARGDAVALLTGAPAFIARPVCNALRIEHCIACECEIGEGRFLPQPPKQHPFADEKLLLAQRLCEKLGYRMEQVAAYGDSFHDRILLGEAGMPVAVYPDRSLAILARQRGWGVISGI
jgi:HAD superfamily phosphoserine phosphatase-like hydrolase